MTHRQDQQLWAGAVLRLRQEVECLPQAERDWIARRLGQIAQLQNRLQSLFEKAGGNELCRRCHGACCARGKHHLTLVNLLGYLLAGEPPPALDFRRTCPSLGETGCHHDAARRPFNCVTFICDQVEAGLESAELTTFYHLEKELRELYLAFDRRFVGSSLRGFLLRAERLEGRSFMDLI